MTKAKPYAIPKQIVWDAYKKVKANGGAGGVDGQSLMEFEKDLKNNLYKLWNRMSSGSYLAPPVRLVEIPKGNTGQTRPLGIPTVSDRIAQMVVKLTLEPQVEPHFHEDSYGYRPGKSALDAVGVTRQRCWRRDWVIKRKTKAKKMRAAMKAIWQWCKWNRHMLIGEQWKKLCQKLRGHYQYFGIRGNYKQLEVYFEYAKRAWKHWLGRRHRNGYIDWETFNRHHRVVFPLPQPKIVHDV